MVVSLCFSLLASADGSPFQSIASWQDLKDWAAQSTLLDGDLIQSITYDGTGTLTVPPTHRLWRVVSPGSMIDFDDQHDCLVLGHLDPSQVGTAPLFKNAKPGLEGDLLENGLLLLGGTPLDSSGGPGGKKPSVYGSFGGLDRHLGWWEDRKSGESGDWRWIQAAIDSGRHGADATFRLIVPGSHAMEQPLSVDWKRPRFIGVGRDHAHIEINSMTVSGFSEVPSAFHRKGRQKGKDFSERAGYDQPISGVSMGDRWSGSGTGKSVFWANHYVEENASVQDVNIDWGKNRYVFGLIGELNGFVIGEINAVSGLAKGVSLPAPEMGGDSVLLKQHAHHVNGLREGALSKADIGRPMIPLGKNPAQESSTVQNTRISRTRILYAF